MSRLVWGAGNPIIYRGASGVWTNLPTVAARVKEITHQLTGLSPSTDYLVEASYTPRYEDPVVGKFPTLDGVTVHAHFA